MIILLLHVQNNYLIDFKMHNFSLTITLRVIFSKYTVYLQKFSQKENDELYKDMFDVRT